jgi:hypothetical protein
MSDLLKNFCGLSRFFNKSVPIFGQSAHHNIKSLEEQRIRELLATLTEALLTETI